MTLIEKLIGSLSRLPGLGKKSASRIVYHLLKTDKGKVEELAHELMELKLKITICHICGNFTDIQPCTICSDLQRDRKTLCVVEEPKDVLSIESIHEYQGLYHVLMGVISPIDGIGPENLRIRQLVERIKKEKPTEVIIATNPTVEGDTTALYLISLLKGETVVTITRPALGLPVGGDLEYADRLTLTRALKGRNQV